jgi:hypothetical protein
VAGGLATQQACFGIAIGAGLPDRECPLIGVAEVLDAPPQFWPLSWHCRVIGTDHRARRRVWLVIVFCQWAVVSWSGAKET